MMADKKELREEMQRHVLIIDLPPDEHNFHFKKNYDAGIYKAYPNKEKASEAYVSVIRSADGVELSAHSPASSTKRSTTAPLTAWTKSLMTSAKASTDGMA